MNLNDRLKKLEALQSRNVQIIALKQKAEGSAELMLALIKTEAEAVLIEDARQRSLMQFEAWLDASADLGRKIREIMR